MRRLHSDFSPYHWALRFASQDIDVAPGFEIADGRCECLNQNCYRPGKHPLLQEDVTTGTRVPSEIQTWWRRRPTANLIVHTGRRSGLVVIDVDAREGGMEHFGQLCDRFFELAETFRVTTGSGGIHAYLRSDASWRSGMDVVSAGVDLRGEGGYVIGPGSRHISGRIYEADDNKRGIFTMSEELRKYLVGIGAAEEKVDAQ